MPQRALPPYLFPAARRDHFGRETAVQRRVPLGGDARLDGHQIVESGEHFFVCAVRAAGPVCAGRNHCLKAVSLLADPPRLAVAGQRDLLRCERSVPFRSASHCAASTGFCDARSLKPGSTSFPVQTGHPLFLYAREEIEANQL